MVVEENETLDLGKEGGGGWDSTASTHGGTNNLESPSSSSASANQDHWPAKAEPSTGLKTILSKTILLLLRGTRGS